MTFPSVPPPAAGLTDALAAARSRRLRAAGVTSGLAAACAVAVALTLSSTGSTSLTQQQEDYTRDPSPLPTASQRSSTALGAVGSAPAPAASPTPPSVVQPAVAAPGRPSPSPTPPGAVPRPAYRAPDLTYSDTVITASSCPIGSSRALCPEARASSATTARRGADLEAYVCSQRTARTTLHFATSREVDLWVTRGGVEKWRWSRSHPATDQPHVRSVEPRQCVSWQLAWEAVTSEGAPLADGDYVLHIAVAASELPEEDVSTAFTLRSP